MMDGLTAFCLEPGVIVQFLCSLLASENFIIKDGLCTCPKSFFGSSYFMTTVLHCRFSPVSMPSLRH